MNNFDYCRMNGIKTHDDMFMYYCHKETIRGHKNEGEFDYVDFCHWLFEKHPKNKNKPKEHILDKQEKRYLRNVILPWRKNVIEIAKRYDRTFDREYITIWHHGPCSSNCSSNIVVKLPFFVPGTMYTGMERFKAYTLKELELDK